MDVLLILSYTALCVAVFKIFKIPLNKWTVPTAVLGGIILIGGLIVTMNYNHPFSENSRDYFVTTPIVPEVTGRVIEVPVQPNMALKKGDVLFRLEDRLYKDKLASITALLTAAEEDLKRAQKMQRQGFGKQQNLDQARAQVDDLRAQKESAEYNLERTVVRAPADGFAIQIALRPGMQAVNIPLRPVMIFKHTEGKHLVGWYRQNSLLRLTPGSEAEVAFDGLPGKVFSAKVIGVVPGITEGQVQPSANMINANPASGPGRIPVLFEVTDERFAEYEPLMVGGAYAQTAIYSEHFHHVAIMRKVLLRMASWMNFFFPFH